MILTGTLALLAAVSIHAGASWAQACDPQFMDAIEARGFAEASRENAHNQSFIYKPDGVFEYSCFRNHVPAVQQNADDLFREGALQFPTTYPVELHNYNNFGDIYLNSRVNDPAIDQEDPPEDMCNAIAVVWDIARCIDFYNREDLDGMFDLTHYTANDPRQLPPSYPACPALPYGALNMALDMAYNNRRDAWTMGPYARDDEDYIIDPVDDLDEMYTPADCGTAIPTGMVVNDTNAPVDQFNEKTCSNPACVYVPSGEDEGTCEMPN